MKLQPLEDRIVVRPSKSEETTASGLVIPDTAKEKPQQGEENRQYQEGKPPAWQVETTPLNNELVPSPVHNLAAERTVLACVDRPGNTQHASR